MQVDNVKGFPFLIHNEKIEYRYLYLKAKKTHVLIHDGVPLIPGMVIYTGKGGSFDVVSLLEPDFGARKVFSVCERSMVTIKKNSEAPGVGFPPYSLCYIPFIKPRISPDTGAEVWNNIGVYLSNRWK